MARSLVAVALALLVNAAIAEAQSFEVTPFAGYRFGGDFLELATGNVLDADGAPAVGVVVDVPLSNGLHIEGLFSHQRARVSSITVFGDELRWDVVVDHWLAGGLQELGHARVRPFLTGLIGLTRYAVEGDNELRFAASGGGGVKLFPTPHLGVRLDGRLSATFVDVGGRTVCAGGCVVALGVDVVWQAEFSAGVVIRFK
jgi:hypothetical protein